MTAEPQPETESETVAADRHATWAELFFDLVAVAGVAALAHVLGPPVTLGALGLYVLLFLAFWLSWTTFTLSSNVDRTRAPVIRLLVGMFGLGVLAASVPGVAHAVLEHGPDDRPLTVFALAYVATRLFGSQSWRRGDLLLDFPVVQATAGLLPWLASVWVDGPWRLGLWGLGAAVDLLLVVTVPGTWLLERMRQHSQRQQGRGGRSRRRGGERSVRGLLADPAHLTERLSLFVIIVLGESVVQVVGVAAEVEQDVALLASGLAAFVLLTGLFGLSVVFGHAGLPHLRAGRIPLRAALGLHCLVTGVIATLAGSLSTVVELGSEPLPDASRWMLCGALSAYFALGVITGVASRSADVRRTVSRIITGVVAPVMLGLFATGLAGSTLVVCLSALVLAHLWYERRLPPIGQP